MKKRNLCVLGLSAIGAVLVLATGENLRGDHESAVLSPVVHSEITQRDRQLPPLEADADFGKLPLYFIPNKGQVDPQARFYARASRYTLWFTAQGLVFDSVKKKPGDNKRDRMAKKSVPESAERDVSRLIFVGANSKPEIVPLDGTEHQVNYFIGNDPKKWHSGIPTFKAVLYREIYPNIDLKVYGVENQIEYDWLVKPGGDPAQIKFRFENVKGTHVDSNGDLLIDTRFGTLTHKKPVAFQPGGDARQAANRREVKVTFNKLAADTWGFSVGEYDRTSPLVIDPVVLLYSTYLGGGVNYEQGSSIAVDGSGCAYVIGHTASTDFPVQNPLQTFQGTIDAFVTKLNTNGNGVVYSTYLGGWDDEWGFGIAVDGSGCAYITGFTESNNFPTQSPFQTYYGNGDAFITKLNANGNGLVYSTFLGGTSMELSYGIAVDGSGCAYITGTTGSGDYPTQNPFQTYQGNWDVFISKLNASGNGLVYSSYLGGWGDDHGLGIAIDDSGCAYITGYTYSDNFTTQNPIQNFQGLIDAFVAKVDTKGSGLVYSTYLGGASVDEGLSIAIDDAGCAYVSGYTESVNFPTKNPFQENHHGFRDAFVSKLNANGNDLIYSTYLAGTKDEWGFCIKVDNSGCAFVTGETFSRDFPILTSFQNFPGKGDVYITKLNSLGNGLVYSTYFGGANTECGYGIAVDNADCVYVTGTTTSSDFPTKNPFQNNYHAYVDAFVTKLVLVNFSLTAIRASDKAWIVQRDYGKIAFSVENGASAPIVKYAVLRKNGSGTFQSLKEVLPAELQNNGYSFLDKWLEKGKTYTYKVEARASDGSVIAASAEVAI